MRLGRERGLRAVAALAISATALAYALAVVVIAWQAPSKGFLAFVGRRIVDVESGSEAERRGVQRGDHVIVVGDHEVRSTLEYAAAVAKHRPGDRVRFVLERGSTGRRYDLTLTVRPSSPPWAGIAACALAAALTVLGLIARFGRPDDIAAQRFWRVTVVYAFVYAGTLSWNLLVGHPRFAAPWFVAMFLAPSFATDFALDFPLRAEGSARRWRVAAWLPTVVMLVCTTAMIGWAYDDWVHDRGTDRALYWVARLLAVQLTFVVLVLLLGFVAQGKRWAELTGAARAQARWLVLGFVLSVVPALAAIPFAIADLDRFLLVGSRPFVLATAVLWCAAASLAVLRVRLADIDAVIHRSIVYAIATGAVVGVYLGVATVVGLAVERVARELPVVSHVAGALAAAALFGPIRSRVTEWLDRRFFRDRLHYVRALRDLADAVQRVREPRELASEVVERVVGALRASGGALYLAASDEAGSDLALAHAVDIDAPDHIAREDALVGELAIPLRRGDRIDGVLRLGPRRGGDLYSAQDRDLVHALAGQLSVAFENAQAFGTIARMNRELEVQNTEIRDLRDRLEDENHYLRGRLDGSAARDVIVGTSKAVRELRSQIERVAPTSSSVLLAGESGTGKGLVARTIHELSDRKDRPFIHVDCGAVAAGVFESELFGHERGAFTGAVRTRRGCFELADHGTLFLDEIGELPIALQPKLLRVLQERAFTRVGGSRQVSVDVRIVAATNRDLQAMVRRGEFREDLYYRLSVVVLEVAPLRQRRGDVPELVELLLPRIAKKSHRDDMRVRPEAVERLAAYGWPGNVRELENVLERAVVLCESNTIGPDDLVLPDAPPRADELVESIHVADDAGHSEVMVAIERQRLEAALRSAGGNRSSAARSLGIPRTTLINKMRRHGLL